MKLHQLYENFSTATPERQRELVAQYRAARTADFARRAEEYDLKKAARRRPDAVTLTEDEKTVMKLLGISKKQLIAMRASAAEGKLQ